MTKWTDTHELRLGAGGAVRESGASGLAGSAMSC